MTMSAPWAASASTTALPMPVLPPVTMATLPFSVMSLLSGGVSAVPPTGLRPRAVATRILTVHPDQRVAGRPRPADGTGHLDRPCPPWHHRRRDPTIR